MGDQPFNLFCYIVVINWKHRFLAASLVLIGIFFTITFQGWGMILMRRIGFERALGVSSVRHYEDGQVLLTNPLGMFLWSLPFLVLGIGLVVFGVRTWRGQRSNYRPQLTGDAHE